MCNYSITSILLISCTFCLLHYSKIIIKFFKEKLRNIEYYIPAFLSLPALEIALKKFTVSEFEKRNQQKDLSEICYSVIFYTIIHYYWQNKN